jgi:hypothetical protein
MQHDPTVMTERMLMMVDRRVPLDDLPFWPLFLGQDEAARYLGASSDVFSAEVAAGLWPAPKRRGSKGGRLTWHRPSLDAAAARDAASDQGSAEATCPSIAKLEPLIRARLNTDMTFSQKDTDGTCRQLTPRRRSEFESMTRSIHRPPPPPLGGQRSDYSAGAGGRLLTPHTIPTISLPLNGQSIRTSYALRLLRGLKPEPAADA